MKDWKELVMESKIPKRGQWIKDLNDIGQIIEVIDGDRPNKKILHLKIQIYDIFGNKEEIKKIVFNETDNKIIKGGNSKKLIFIKKPTFKKQDKIDILKLLQKK